MTSAEETSSQRPPITVSGPATAHDIAAIVAVLASAGGGGGADQSEADTERFGGWADHRRGLRSAVSHGAGAWRATFRAP